ncbi:MAG: hypothetical protein ACI837_001022 [Crocinitomicaceae bacterium]
MEEEIKTILVTWAKTQFTRMKNYCFLLALLLLSFSQLSAQTLNSAIKPIDNRTAYQHSITEAMSPDSSKIYTDLIQIDADNENLTWKTVDGVDYILVVTWKGDASWYEKYLDSAYYPTGDFPIWVSTSPELLKRMRSGKTKDVDMRLKQLIGLPPSSVYNYFVEFWVKPDDLIRPCPDSEITDKQCELCFPAGADSTYMAWVNENRISRYYKCALDDKYPWTQLGYTYDWSPANPSHVGLSEFVIGVNKKILINKIYTTAEYLAKEID